MDIITWLLLVMELQEGSGSSYEACKLQIDDVAIILTGLKSSSDVSSVNYYQT